MHAAACLRSSVSLRWLETAIRTHYPGANSDETGLRSLPRRKRSGVQIHSRYHQEPTVFALPSKQLTAGVGEKATRGTRAGNGRGDCMASIDWTGWALFGFVATGALTAVLVGAQLGGLTRMDIPLMLGTTAVADPDRDRVVGSLMHLVIGQGFALGYAASFRCSTRRTDCSGPRSASCMASSPSC